VVSVDGLNPDAITTLGQSRLPALTELAAEGASTLNARSSYEATVTLPNHTSILTGRTIAGPEGSSVTVNNDPGGTLENLHGSYVPGVFDVAHDHGFGTGFFAEKTKFNFLLRSWDAQHGAPDIVGEDNGSDKVDAGDVAPATRLLPQLSAALTDQSAQLLFLHIAAPDTAGHAQGFMSAAYLEAVVDADAEIGEILDLVRARPALQRSVTIVVTADHGGVPPGHRFVSVLGNYRIPFFVWGRGVRPGSDLYRLNAGARLDPGTARPAYRGSQPVRNRDAASLALDLLGLPALPGTTTPLRVR
jgi:predicted AlkP superfamily pyrophosphatase or phosphodiesterase